MTDYAAILTALAVLVTAVAAAFVSIRGKLIEIHTLTNNSLTAVKSELAVSAKEVAGLREMIRSMDDAKAVADHVAEKAVLVVNGSGKPVEPKPEK